jgi:hypothetical protein
MQVPVDASFSFPLDLLHNKETWLRIVTFLGLQIWSLLPLCFDMFSKDSIRRFKQASSSECATWCSTDADPLHGEDLFS